MNENEELIERRSELRKRVDVLEWDRKRMQINPALRAKLEKYKKELEEIAVKLTAEPAEENDDAASV